MPFDFEIDLDSGFPETWFGDAPGKRVCLRLPEPEKAKELKKRFLTPKKTAVLNPFTRRMELADDDSNCDYDGFFVALTCLAIVDWDIADVHGKAVSCTEENKKALLKDVRFLEFVKECLEELNKQAKLTREEESKN